MYTRILIPLDGSKAAEKVLPYARALAGRLKVPVELMEVVDIAEMVTHIAVAKARYLDTMIEDRARSSEAYLRGVAKTFPEAAVNLGTAHLKSARPEAALAAYSRAVSLRRDYADAICGQALCLRALDRLDEARAAYQKAADQGADNASAAVARLKGVKTIKTAKATVETESK